MLQSEGHGLTMVFCETKRACDMVSEQLKERGFAAAAVHGDLGQGQREQALRAFRNGKIDVLVATDVAARGIDIDDVTHVVNYDCPQDEKAYVHRIGRTGRAGRTGVAVTFVEWEELTRWKVINNALGLDFAEPVETYSTSPHVYTDLGIPEGTKGVLPRAQRSRAGLDAEQIEDIGETGRHRSRKERDDRTERADRSERRERPARNRQRKRTRNGQVPEESVSGSAPAEPAEAGFAPGGAVDGDVLAPEPRVAAVQAVVEPVTAPARPETAPATDPVTSAESSPRDDVPAEVPAPRRARRGANRAALSGALAEVTPTTEDGGATAPAAQEDLIDVDEYETVARRASVPSFTEAPVSRPEPERIIPPTPFSIIFQSPDLATDDDVAPSAASERVQQRRRPAYQRPRRS